MILILAALAGTATPQLNGHLIRTGEVCYTISRLGMNGLQPVGTMRQTVQRRTSNGVDALEIATHQQISNPKGDINIMDYYLVRRADLRPIAYRSSSGGKTTVELAYTNNGVTGTKQVKDQAVAVAQRFDKPIWDSNILGRLIGSLPLKTGETYRLPSFNYAQGIGEFVFTIVGQEMVETPRGPERAWIIDAFREPASLVRYFISTSSRQELGYLGMGFRQDVSNTCPKPV